MFACARCGETVTCPYFYQGAVYGWTCIGIVCPGRKRDPRKLALCAWYELSLPDWRNNIHFKCKLVGMEHKRYKGYASLVSDGVYYAGSDFVLFQGKLYVDTKYAVKQRIETV